MNGYQLAANQLSFERQQHLPAFIQGDYWLESEKDQEVVPTEEVQEKTDRRGVTGSARLLQDIYKLDQHAFDTRQRKHHLKQSISLSTLFPYEFQQFRETGVLSFTTPMELFDRGFPGHYLRLIKRVSVSVIALVPPLQGIRATLSSGGISRAVTGESGAFQSIEIQRSSEMITFTSPVNATGLSELQAENELLMPFEGMGVDTNWELKIPKAANPFNFGSIADVIFSIDYTALHSFEYQKLVVENLDRSFSAERAYSIRKDFPDLWYQLNNPAMQEERREPEQASIALSLDRSYFPSNLVGSTIKMDSLLLLLAGHDEKDDEIEVSQLTVNSDSFDAVTSLNGVISSLRTSASNWNGLIGKSPIGEWEITFADDVHSFQKRLGENKVDDIMFILGYSGETPEWV